MSKISRNIKRKKAMAEQKDRVSKLGKIVSIDVTNDSHKSSILLCIKFDTGVELQFCHIQDCCEAVWLEDGLDELSELVGNNLISLEKSQIDLHNTKHARDDLHVATFYKLKTTGGYATLRFEGMSNGYYGVEVNAQLVHGSREVSLKL